MEEDKRNKNMFGQEYQIRIEAGRNKFYSNKINPWVLILVMIVLFLTMYKLFLFAGLITFLFASSLGFLSVYSMLLSVRIFFGINKGVEKKFNMKYLILFIISVFILMATFYLTI